MHIKRQLTVVLALAMAGALAAASVALARDANSTTSFNFTKTPKGNVGTTFKRGKLFVHTHTNYTGPGTKTDRTQLYFDKNFSFNTNAVPKCRPAQLAGNNDMAFAMSRCKKALVGSGTATANAVVPGDAKSCVLAFNGKLAGGKPGILLFTRVNVVGPISCANPAANHNGNVTVLLQAPLKTNPAKTSPGGKLAPAFYKRGKWLDFNHITDVAALPLSDFKVTTGKGARFTSLAGKKGNFVRAKCTKRSGLGPPAKKWVLRSIYTYTTGVPKKQVVNSKHRCK
jgi:hypothetical protein